MSQRPIERASSLAPMLAGLVAGFLAFVAAAAQGVGFLGCVAAGLAGMLCGSVLALLVLGILSGVFEKWKELCCLAALVAILGGVYWAVGWMNGGPAVTDAPTEDLEPAPAARQKSDETSDSGSPVLAPQTAAPTPAAATFSADDLSQTLRWIGERCQRVEQARRSQNDELWEAEWNTVSAEFERVSGSQVSWRIPVAGLRQGFLRFETLVTEPDVEVYVSTFGGPFNWPPAALRRRPFPGNQAERRLPLRGEAQVRLSAGEVPGLETSFVGDMLSLGAGRPVFVRGKASLALSQADREVDVVIAEATLFHGDKSVGRLEDEPGVTREDVEALRRELRAALAE